ncbi:MAG: recombination protein O N-terminal domain-containing protein [Flavobacteriaceae bacterium]|jgi:DNA repair protein RecO (recombination protein O)|nr:recombination protein O N-terminal domain-containing protein [Flavobacteriaceae bacterium]
MTNLKGFLLSNLKYSDHDAILNFYTENFGYQTFFAKGIYASKTLKKSLLFPLNELEIFTQNSLNETGKLPNIQKLELVKSGYDGNPDIGSILMFAADFLNQILKRENASELIYREISNFMLQLSKSDFSSHIYLVFNMLKHNGWLPLKSNEIFLNPETGSFTDAENHYLFNKGISKIWKIFLNSEHPHQIKLKRKERNAFLESLMLYYKLHFTNFKYPESLEILKILYQSE